MVRWLPRPGPAAFLPLSWRLSPHISAEKLHSWPLVQVLIRVMPTLSRRIALMHAAQATGLRLQSISTSNNQSAITICYSVVRIAKAAFCTRYPAAVGAAGEADTGQDAGHLHMFVDTASRVTIAAGFVIIAP